MLPAPPDRRFVDHRQKKTPTSEEHGTGYLAPAAQVTIPGLTIAAMPTATQTMKARILIITLQPPVSAALLMPSYRPAA
jgi:hypothetical protein